jgi:hypothetical protein
LASSQVEWTLYLSVRFQDIQASWSCRKLIGMNLTLNIHHRLSRYHITQAHPVPTELKFINNILIWK